MQRLSCEGPPLHPPSQQCRSRVTCPSTYKKRKTCEQQTRTITSFISLPLLVLGDVEVHQLVGSLAAGDHTDVVTEGLLLQVLLGEVLEREGSS